MICRLCNASNLSVCASVAAADIASIYKQDLDIDLFEAGCRAAPSELSLLICGVCQLKQFAPDWVGADGLYRELQKHGWYYQACKHEFQVAASRVRSGQAVLEVGCGSGKFQPHLPPGVRYVGLDTNPSAVEGARANGLDVRAQDIGTFAAGHLGRFDVACAFQVLEHVPRPREFLSALASTVRSGGLVVLSVPGDDGFTGREVNNVLNMPPHHCTRWPDATLLRLAEYSGMQFLELTHEPLSPGHVRGAALARVWMWLTRWLRLPRGALLVWAHSKFRRRAVSVASLPTRWLMHMAAPVQRGHTTTVLLMKP